MSVDLIRWGQEQARTGPWRGDGSVAYLTPVPDAPAPSADFVRRCCEELAAQGFSRVITAALAPAEQQGFRAAGFEVAEELCLLSRDVADVPPVPAVPAVLRRARRSDHPAVLGIDEHSFSPFWQLGRPGLEEALAATPHTRFRVAQAPDGSLAGYAVVGRAGRRGFLQRLAVHPGHRRRRVGQALVLDGLRWLRRWRVERAVVNTQLDNQAALSLYQRLGFRQEPAGLTVLTCGLP